VVRAQVEVADFKSGQIAQVMGASSATAFANGKSGLSLGLGRSAPSSTASPASIFVERVPVPRGRLVPRSAMLRKPEHPAVAARQRHSRQAGVTRISSRWRSPGEHFHRVN
jgi:hypothetical protein